MATPAFFRGCRSTSANPDIGQRQIVRVLRDMNELRLKDDEPDSPVFIRERTSLKKGRIGTAQLRDEYRRNPALPMLVGDDVFHKGIRNGIEQREFGQLATNFFEILPEPAKISVDTNQFPDLPVICRKESAGAFDAVT